MGDIRRKGTKKIGKFNPQGPEKMHSPYRDTYTRLSSGNQGSVRGRGERTDGEALTRAEKYPTIS
jgi:hypothetical protein